MQLKSELSKLEMEKLNLLKLVHQHSRECQDSDIQLKLQQVMDSGLVTTRGSRDSPTLSFHGAPT